MRVFICWSGETSRQVATALRDWIQRVLQSVDPFMSEADIEKGEPWMARLSVELQDTSFAILCVTPDNLASPWLHFEAGAIWKGLQQSRATPFLFHVEPQDITHPLSHFQNTRYARDDVLRLVETLNSLVINPLSSKLLTETFDRWWPDLEQALQAISLDDGTEVPIRNPSDIQLEILETVRTIAAQFAGSQESARWLAALEVLTGREGASTTPARLASRHFAQLRWLAAAAETPVNPDAFADSVIALKGTIEREIEEQIWRALTENMDTTLVEILEAMDHGKVRLSVETLTGMKALDYVDAALRLTIAGRQMVERVFARLPRPLS